MTPPPPPSLRLLGLTYFFFVADLCVQCSLKPFRSIPSGLTLSGPGGGGSAPSNFNLRELSCYLRNTYETLPLLLKYIGEQDSGNFFVKDISCCHGNQIFDAMQFSQILTFLIFFVLINNFFKTNANSLPQSQ